MFHVVPAGNLDWRQRSLHLPARVIPRWGHVTQSEPFPRTGTLTLEKRSFFFFLIGYQLAIFQVSWSKPHVFSKKQGQHKKRKDKQRWEMAEKDLLAGLRPQLLSWRFWVTHIGLTFSSLSYSTFFLAMRANTFPFVFANPFLLI